jgi:hypothetical protein
MKVIVSPHGLCKGANGTVKALPFAEEVEGTKDVCTRNMSSHGYRRNGNRDLLRG